jgi:hypothetical protein
MRVLALLCVLYAKSGQLVCYVSCLCQAYERCQCHYRLLAPVMSAQQNEQHAASKGSLNIQAVQRKLQ